MRTTVTLEADVERLVRDSMSRGRKSFKQTINEALRRGLRAEAPREDPPYEISARPMGLREGIDPNKLHSLDDEFEIDEFLRKTDQLRRQTET